MKKLTLIYVILAVVLNSTAQINRKNHLINYTYHQWQWNKYGCLDKWSVTFENKTKSTIVSITFRLIIKELETKTILYKKTHTVNYTLGSYEIVPSPYFNLSQELCGLKNIQSLEDYHINIEVISFK